MADYNTFKNVKTVTIGGVSITDPTSVTYGWSDDLQSDATDGATFNTKQAFGRRERTMVVNGRDSVSLFSALGDEGSCSFTLQDGEGGADTEYSVGTGKVVQMSFGSGDVGALGSGSVTAILKGAPA